jgi:hypothetical protein
MVHLAAKPEAMSAAPELLAAAPMLRATVVEAGVAEPAPLMTILYVPVAAVDDVERVSVVLHVAAQLEGEKAAVTPLGSEDAEKYAATELPAVKVAVMP